MTEVQTAALDGSFGNVETVQQPGGTVLSSECSGEFVEPFERIIGAITEYHKQLGYPNIQCNSHDHIKQSNEIVVAMMREVGELQDSFPWKPWKAYDAHEMKADLVNMAEECVDIIFFISAMLELWGVPAAMLGTVLENKLIENKRRIAIGYNKPSDEMK